MNAIGRDVTFDAMLVRREMVTQQRTAAVQPPWFKQYYKQRGLLVLVLPCMLLLILFQYVPMAGLAIAFKEFNLSVGILRSPWIGLENFQRLFSNVDFPRALLNTFIISMLRLVFGFFAPIMLALMLNEVRLEGFKRSIQTLTYLPYFFSWVILGGIFVMMFAGDGPINTLLQMAAHAFNHYAMLHHQHAHLLEQPIEFVGKSVPFIVILIVTGIWQGTGFGAVIYLAALSGISPDLYEAASIDGASRWQQLLHVTLPALVPTMVVLFILSLGGILNAGFDQIYNMYNSMVYNVSDIIDTYVLRHTIAMDFSLSTAAGLFKSVVGMVFICSANWLAGRLSKGEQGIW
jgi:putative aldouronate transport system permease protein